MPPEAREFFAFLLQSGVRFVVVSAQSFPAPRAPKDGNDFDFIVDPSPDNFSAQSSAARGVSFDAVALRTEAGLRLARRLHDETPLDGMSFEKLWTRANAMTVDGLALRVFGKPKLGSNR